MKPLASRPIDLKSVRVSDPFWSDYVELVRNTVIPYQWEALNDRIPNADPSHAVRNFRIAAGLEEGEFGGLVFQDSDVAKWLEAVGYSLSTHPDPELEAVADAMIDIIEKAQQPDGYLDTYFILKEPGKQWTNLCECHELYVAGHMMEAAVSYFQATGKRKLLDVMCRFADAIDKVFGPEPGKIHGYDGHQEVELALFKMYEATGNETYLKLSRYFIDERGKTPHFFNEEWEHVRKGYSYWRKGPVPAPDLAYHQAHKPVREQEAAVGHAVRAVYMYSGMADVARETGDEELLEACRRLWSNIVGKQMYITGGIGSTHHGEAFSFDYDLPNDTVYAESCASIGLFFFAHRMLRIEAKSQYADVMERVLYNTVLGSMSRDGKHFFYVNPLEVWPEASVKNPGKHHVKPVRQKWFGCACCPPNIARLLSSLNQYIYTFNEHTLFTHLYIGGEIQVAMGKGSIHLRQESRYPWEGHIRLSVATSSAGDITLALRIPDWCRNWSVCINGRDAGTESAVDNGYVLLKRDWKADDEVELHLDMPAVFMQANTKVRADAGKLSIQRGPLVYCLEEADNGGNLSNLAIDVSAELALENTEDLPGSPVVIRGKGMRLIDGDEEKLYAPLESREREVELKAVPYYLWGNREPGEMLVWIRRK